MAETKYAITLDNDTQIRFGGIDYHNEIWYLAQRIANGNSYIYTSSSLSSTFIKHSQIPVTSGWEVEGLAVGTTSSQLWMIITDEGLTNIDKFIIYSGGNWGTTFRPDNLNSNTSHYDIALDSNGYIWFIDLSGRVWKSNNPYDLSAVTEQTTMRFNKLLLPNIVEDNQLMERASNGICFDANDNIYTISPTTNKVSKWNGTSWEYGIITGPIGYTYYDSLFNFETWKDNNNKLYAKGLVLLDNALYTINTGANIDYIIKFSELEDD